MTVRPKGPSPPTSRCGARPGTWSHGWTGSLWTSTTRRSTPVAAWTGSRASGPPPSASPSGQPTGSALRSGWSATTTRTARSSADVYEADVGAWVVEEHGVPLDMVEFATIAVTPELAAEHNLLDGEGWWTARARRRRTASRCPSWTRSCATRSPPGSSQHAGRRCRGREAELTATLRLLVEQGVEAHVRGREEEPVSTSEIKRDLAYIRRRPNKILATAEGMNFTDHRGRGRVVIFCCLRCAGGRSARWASSM